MSADPSPTDGESAEKGVEKGVKESAQAAAAAAVARGDYLKPELLLPDLDWAYAHSHDKVDENLFILLHGMGDTYTNFADLAATMALPQTATLALSAGCDLPFGLGRTWFPMLDAECDQILLSPSKGTCNVCGSGPDTPDDMGSLKLCGGCRLVYYCSTEHQREDWKAHKKACSHAKKMQVEQTKGWETAVDGVLDTIDAAVEQCGYAYERVFVFGFSQGGSVALGTLLRGSHKLGGVVSVSGQLPVLTHVGLGEWEGSVDALSTPAIVTHGDCDEAVAVGPAKARIDRLNRVRKERAGADAVGFVTVAGKGHAMISGEDEMREIMTFLSENLSLRNLALEHVDGVVRVA